MNVPAALAGIQRETEALGFSMASEPQTGSLLRTLAASKPGGALLELGTGTGMGTAWLLDGMDPEATLDSVDNDAAAAAIARRHLGGDPRLTLHVQDGAGFILGLAGREFDFIFADTWAGKYHTLEVTLALLKPGGLYVVDDMLPQPGWPDGHAGKAAALAADLGQRQGLTVCRLDWATGLIVAVRSGSGLPTSRNGAQ
jgi:predicted O-methyltransferase YrrM